MTERKCWNCGHKESDHIEKCIMAISDGKATYVCNCPRFYENKEKGHFVKFKTSSGRKIKMWVRD